MVTVSCSAGGWGTLFSSAVKLKAQPVLCAHLPGPEIADFHNGKMLVN